MTQSTVRTKVHFDKSHNRWLAVNGKTIAFPAGRAGRRNALRWALACDEPELNLLVTEMLGSHREWGKLWTAQKEAWLIDRLLKACQLVTHGHVLPGGLVRSQSTQQTYTVTHAGMPKVWACTCDDFARGQMRRAGQSPWGGCETDYGLMCKHTLACLLADLQGEKS